VAVVSIARASLVYEWRRYLAALLSVTFAGLLVVVQAGLLQGLFGSVSLPVDRSAAQLWLTFPNVLSVDLARPMSRHADALARMHPAALRVESYSITGGDVRRPDGVAVSIFVHLIDTRPGALAFSELLTPAQRALLDEPDALIVDVADLGKFGVDVGGLVEINGKRARVAEAVEGLRTIGGVTAIASFETGRRFDESVRRDEPYYLLLQLRPEADKPRVAREIADTVSPLRYSVWNAAELSQRSQLYWLLESGVGIGAGFGALLAVVVGVVITSQTLSAAILASLKEFAALRALGVSHGQLRAVVLELAGWIGVVGLVLTGMLTLLLATLADAYHVAMAFSGWLLAGTAVTILLITTLSGLYALRPLFKAEPANLLR
jgi:putative ABC transport system permease protein